MTRRMSFWRGSTIYYYLRFCVGPSNPSETEDGESQSVEYLYGDSSRFLTDLKSCVGLATH